MQACRKAAARFAAVALIIAATLSFSGRGEARSDVVTTMLSQINAVRASQGLGPVQIDARLMQAAQLQSQDMAARGHVSHAGSGGSLTQRVAQTGMAFGYVVENVAAGYPDPVQTVEQWMHSPGHRENLLQPAVQAAGIGYVPGGRGYGNFWTLILAQPMA